MDKMELVDQAIAAREKSYSPYSGFAVGAALLTKSGRVFTGCNVENVSLRLTMCAEQGAVAAAIAQGERDFSSIAVVAASKKPVVPCGGCRQLLAEFNPDMEVIISTLEKVHESVLLSDLLPRPAEGILESKKNV
jgi:cytidine deaminase